MRTLLLFGLIAFMATVSLSSPNDVHVTSTPVLGKPFGSRTVIMGTKAKLPTMTSNPFDVIEIDGRGITNAVNIEIRGGVSIQRGIRYRLEGYESGGFEGDPEWFNPQVQQPFQFRNFFVVTKVLESKSQ